MLKQQKKPTIEQKYTRRLKTKTDHLSEPVIPISYGSTEVIETGKWSFQKPHTAFMTAPCQEACPAGINIPQFLYLTQEGMYEEAFFSILRENPFPGVCGRVCFHPCEADCNRGQYDESVSIRTMERYVSDRGSDQLPHLNRGQDSDSREVAVVGAGPAGLSCGYFLALLGHKVTIFEAKKEPGGVMRWGIPGYRLPKSVLKKEIQRILNLPVQIKTRVNVGKDISFDELACFDAVFLSPGARLNRPLLIEGEDLKQVWKGGDFLERINSKEKISLGKSTLVVGGGNTALDVARSALRLGSTVTVAYRRTRAEMPAIDDEIIEAEEEGVGFQFLIQPIKVRLRHHKKLAVTFQKMKLGGLDQSNRLKAIPIKRNYLTLEADHLIAAVGEQVDLSWIPQNLIKNGLVEANPSLKVFAGGDAVAQHRTIVTAISSGKKAAISIDLRLRGGSPEQVFPKIRVGNKGSVSIEAYLAGREEQDWKEPLKVVSYDKLNTLFFKPTQRIKDPQLNLAGRLKSFSEVNIGVSSEEASLSVSRCFTCGTCNYCYNCYFFCPEGVIFLDPIHQTKIVDLEHCKGCGTCATSCPRNVVAMKEAS